MKKIHNSSKPKFDAVKVIWPDGKSDHYRSISAAILAMKEYEQEGGIIEGTEIWTLIHFETKIET